MLVEIQNQIHNSKFTSLTAPGSLLQREKLEPPWQEPLTYTQPPKSRDLHWADPLWTKTLPSAAFQKQTRSAEQRAELPWEGDSTAPLLPWHNFMGRKSCTSRKTTARHWRQTKDNTTYFTFLYSHVFVLGFWLMGSEHCSSSAVLQRNPCHHRWVFKGEKKPWDKPENFQVHAQLYNVRYSVVFACHVCENHGNLKWAIKYKIHVVFSDNIST